MCVAGKDSSWRDRKSSRCLSWCFCFSGRFTISGFSISSSSSPEGWNWKKVEQTLQIRQNNDVRGENEKKNLDANAAAAVCGTRRADLKHT